MQALISAHKNNLYPPRFILELCGEKADKSVKFPVKLTNGAQCILYEINLYMPSESIQESYINITLNSIFMCTGVQEESQQEIQIYLVI